MLECQNCGELTDSTRSGKCPECQEESKTINLKDYKEKPCYIVKCPSCNREIEVMAFQVKHRKTWCSCLDKNGKLNEFKLELN